MLFMLNRKYYQYIWTNSNYFNRPNIYGLKHNLVIKLKDTKQTVIRPTVSTVTMYYNSKSSLII